MQTNQSIPRLYKQFPEHLLHSAIKTSVFLSSKDLKPTRYPVK
jgi:hypothetical protein